MLTNPFSMLINGELVAGEEQFDVENPATGKTFATAPDCTQDELNDAVHAARTAFPSWRALSMDERRKLILEFATKIGEQAQGLASLLTKEQGKKLEDSLADINGGAWWLAETTNYDLPEIVSEDSETRLAITKHEPFGVVAGLVPWNFPIMLAMFKVAPALLAGNTMILKPAPTTPLTTLRIGEIANSIFPPGVLNVISGSDRLGPWVTAHRGVDKVSFTGSTQTGRLVMNSAAASLKPVTLELGGNDASIVMPSANPDQIVESLFWSAFTNAGQVCIASKRMYVHEQIYDRVKDNLAEYAKSVKVGDGANQGTQVGPVQNKKQFELIKSLLQESRAQNHAFLVGGEITEQEGYFIPITLLDNPPESARIVQEEQFGPILPLIKFSSVDEVIESVNSGEYGLGASVWTNDDAEADHIAAQLNVGTVWVNEVQHLSPHASFGGWKQSGIGSEGGQEGLLAFTQTKTIFKAKPADAAL